MKAQIRKLIVMIVLIAATLWLQIYTEKGERLRRIDKEPIETAGRIPKIDLHEIDVIILDR